MRAARAVLQCRERDELLRRGDDELRSPIAHRSEERALDYVDVMQPRLDRRVLRRGRVRVDCPPVFGIGPKPDVRKNRDAVGS